MAPSRRSRRSIDDDLDDETDAREDLEEDEEETPRRRRRASHRSSDRDRPPPRRWRSPDDPDGEDEEPGVPPTWSGSGPRRRPPVFYRARDSLYFEPLVALAIIVVLLVSLYAYTSNWPPIYVVESNSMQHGSNDVVGLINTGDLVLAQKVAPSTIVPYVVGLATSFSTYGEYGDVILYHPNGAGATPVIHRALVYLVWDPTSSTYSAPQLDGLPCGNLPNAVYSTTGTPAGCGTTGLTGTLELYRIGWRAVNVSIDLSAPALGAHSGYVTMGDNNYVCSGPSGCIGTPDQTGTPYQISSLVETGWIIGVARGMLPWFGALKLLLEGHSSMVPPQSWQFMGLTIAGVILLAFGVHWALRAEGIESPIRKEEDEARRAKDDPDDEEDRGRGRRSSGSSLRAWGGETSDRDERSDADERPNAGRSVPRKSSRSDRRGRPPPKVRRADRHGRRPRDEDL